MNARQLGLDEGLEHLDAPVKAFMAERDQFHATLDHLICRERDEGTYEVPVVVVEVEDVSTGERSLKVVLANSPKVQLSQPLISAIHRVVSGEASVASRVGLDPADAAMIGSELRPRLPAAGLSKFMGEQLQWLDADEVRP